MGNRSHLILNQNNSKSKLILESNNHLPFFWLLLLDINTIEKNELKFLNCFQNENEIFDSNFIINKELVEKNSENAKIYLKKYKPQLTAKFEQFSEYIKTITSENVVELDCIEFTEFYTSPNEFLKGIKKTLYAIQSMTPLDKKDLSQYLYETNYFYLVGYDDFVDIELKFSDFSKEYKQLQINYAKKKAIQRIEQEATAQKVKKKEKREKLKNGIFFCFVGLFTVAAGITMIFTNEFLKAISCIIFGLLLIAFGYFQLKNYCQQRI